MTRCDECSKELGETGVPAIYVPGTSYVVNVSESGERGHWHEIADKDLCEDCAKKWIVELLAQKTADEEDDQD